MIVAQKETVGLATAGRPPKIGTKSEPISKCGRCGNLYDGTKWDAAKSGGRCPYCVSTLAEAGIDKKLSARAQKMAAVSERDKAIAGLRELDRREGVR
jgi:hypothetical protein